MSSALAGAIASQPEALELMLARELGDAPNRLAGARRIWLVGTGTSQHAAELGALMLRSAGRDVAWSSSASFVSAFPALTPADAVIVISHTAGTSFAQTARARAVAAGAQVVSITGVDRGWSEAVETVPVEQSETYTISYTSTLLVLARLSLVLGATAFDDAALGLVPDGVRRALAQTEPDMPLPSRTLVIAGSGPAAITAREGALKLREAARVLSEGYEDEYLLHGGAVPLGPEDALLLISARAGPDRLLPRLGEAAGAAGLSVHSLVAPDGLPPLLAQIPLTVSLQRLAERAARERAQNPDLVIVGPWAASELWAIGGPPG